MGQLVFAPNDVLYLDTAPIIYSIEKHADFWALMQPVWKASQAGEIRLMTSELALLETLVAPIKNNDYLLTAAYEQLLTQTEIRLLPVSAKVLRAAAKLRASFGLKTPDAIHAATAIENNCNSFVSNDAGFRRVSNLNAQILKDLI